MAKWQRFTERFQEEKGSPASDSSSLTSKFTFPNEQEFMRSLLAQNRAALQEVLAETSERILETSMQQMVNFQSKVTQRQDEFLAQQKKEEDGSPPPQMIGGAVTTGKWGKNKWKKNRDGDKSGDEPSVISPLQPAIAPEVSFDEKESVRWIGMQSLPKLGADAAGEIWAGITGTRENNGYGPDAESMKTRLRAELAQPTYDVTNFYETSGIWQSIARSPIFENLTLCVIAFNAIWIAVDVDLNDAHALHKADAIFVLMDNFFCIYFLVEITIRYRAFADKRNCLKDVWFVFDTFMASLMVVETWVMTLIFLIFSIDVSGGDGDGQTGNVSVLRIFRFARLVRLARVMHVCRALPELMVVIKGMAIATRAVSCTVALMLLIVYVFAVLFRQLTDGSALGRMFFKNVPISMRFLLLYGTTPDLAETAVAIWDENVFYAIIFLLFILVVTITIMNMLVGVLVGVVQTVSTVEKEGAMVAFMKNNLLTILNKMHEQDEDCNGLMSRDEFMVLLESKEALHALGHIGVDVIGLLDLADFIFRDGHELTYQDFMELVMQLRGSNQATVKDIVDLRKFIALELNQIEKEESMILSCLKSVAHNMNLKRRQEGGESGLRPMDYMEASMNLMSATMTRMQSDMSLGGSESRMTTETSLAVATPTGLPSYLKPVAIKEQPDQPRFPVAGAQTDSVTSYKKGKWNSDGRKPFKRQRQSVKSPQPNV